LISVPAAIFTSPPTTIGKSRKKLLNTGPVAAATAASETVVMKVTYAGRGRGRAAIGMAEAAPGIS